MKNKFKKTEKHPDYIVTVAEEKPEREPGEEDDL